MSKAFEDLEKLDKAELIGMLWATESLVVILEHKLLAFPELEALAKEVAKEYEDAADWKDAIGKLQNLANSAISKIGG
jgi:hypothetical protein